MNTTRKSPGGRASSKVTPKTFAPNNVTAKKAATQRALKIKVALAVGGMKKLHRYRLGTVTQREKRKLQWSIDLLIRRLPFQRFVQDIFQDIDQDFRCQSGAMQALQEAAGSYIVELLKDTHACAS